MTPHRFPALLMIRLARSEIQRYAPPNFYRWSRRSREHYILKRWPTAEFVCNGVPLNLPYSEAFSIHINNPEEEDPFQSEDYQRFIAEAAKHCSAPDSPCDSCLAGGICDGIPNNDDDNFDLEDSK